MRHPVKLLRVESEYFLAGAVWEKIYGIWSCTRAAMVLRWMVGMNSDRAKLALAKMGADWCWVGLRQRQIKNQQSGPNNCVDLTGNHQSGFGLPGAGASMNNGRMPRLQSSGLGLRSANKHSTHAREIAGLAETPDDAAYQSAAATA